MSDLNKELEALTIALGEAKATFSPIHVEIKDHSEFAAPHLSDASKFLMAKKASTQVLVEDNEPYMSAYLSKVVREDQIEETVKILADKYNQLVEKGLVHSTLAPISSVELAQLPKQHKAYGVFVMPLVPCKRESEVKEIVGSLYCQEGQFNTDNRDIEKVLPEGQFYAEVRLTIFPGLCTGKTQEEILQDQIDQYLKVLPAGTYLVSAEKRAIVDLSLPYEVILANPLLPSLKEVKLQYFRHCERVRGEIKQMNLIFGVEYDFGTYKIETKPS